MNMGHANPAGPLLLIDWSVVMYQNWFTMKSPNYQAKSDLELKEFARNCAQSMVELLARFQPSETVFCLDHPKNWRIPVFDSYYAAHVNYWKEKARPHSWVVDFDAKKYAATWNDRTENWFFDKLGTDAVILAVGEGSPVPNEVWDALEGLGDDDPEVNR